MTRSAVIFKIYNNYLRVFLVLLFATRMLNGNFASWETLLLTFLLSFYDVVLEKLFKLKFRGGTKIFLTTFLVFAMIFGTVFNFYGIFPEWDLFLHFNSGILVFLLGKELVENINRNLKLKPLDKRLVLIYAFFFTLAVGNLWEIIEFLCDEFLKLDTQRTDNLVGHDAVRDTMGDLISSTASAILMLTFSLSGIFGRIKSLIKLGKLSEQENDKSQLELSRLA